MRSPRPAAKIIHAIFFFIIFFYSNWDVWTRTTIARPKFSCPTIGRHPKFITYSSKYLSDPPASTINSPPNGISPQPITSRLKNSDVLPLHYRAVISARPSRSNLLIYLGGISPQPISLKGSKILVSYHCPAKVSIIAGGIDPAFY